MPGMGTGLATNNPTIVSAFHNELLRQGLVVLLILLLVSVAWSFLRTAQLRQAAAGAGTAAAGAATAPAAGYFPAAEPAARRALRVGFGLLWLFDGILQGQASMPLGMVPQVIAPAAGGAPSWAQHIVTFGTNVWSYHPVTVAAAVVWVQGGIGIWLLAASRGTWSRLAGVAGAAWGLSVWVFGEAFGQLLSPGPSWLFGAPGAALIYCVAGVLVALSDAAWVRRRLGVWLPRATGLSLLAMALLQAWPGRGFWQGRASGHHPTGSLTAMARQMAATPQPHLLASWVAAFARFDAGHGWGVNLFVVVALGAGGLLLVSGTPHLVRAGSIITGAVSLATWALVQDLGFMGGVGTDPNSMVPMVVLLLAGYVALARAPALEPATEPVTAGAEVPWRKRLALNPTYAFRSVAAVGALAVTLVGTAPMALAATNAKASPILAQAFDGAPEAINLRAPSITLVDQYGRTVALDGLRGKVVVLAFLDPVCTSDCPVIAQELKQADGLLGRAAARSVEMVAIDANPTYTATPYLHAFDQQEGLARLGNWLYLTGTAAQLRASWRELGVDVQYLPGGSMVQHSDFAYLLDRQGRIRYYIDDDPGPGTKATQASFAVTLAGYVQRLLARP